MGIKNMLKKNHRRKNGFTIVETLMVLAIGTMVGLGVAVPMLQAQKANKRIVTAFWLDQMKAEMISYVNGGKSWTNTVTNNAALACITSTTTACTPMAAPAALDLYDGVNGAGAPNGNLAFQGTNPAFGFTGDGRTCTTFSSTTGNDLCPFGVTLRYQFICKAPCWKPDVKVMVSLTYNPQTKTDLAYNTSDFAFNVLRGQQANRLIETCISLGGTWMYSTNGNSVGEFCQFSLNDTTSCPIPGQVLSGFDASGNKICIDPGSTIQCNPPTMMTGINPGNGEPICAPAPTCPACI
jgi:type II secretory pathway pseudopilin PulG